MKLGNTVEATDNFRLNVSAVERNPRNLTYFQGEADHHGHYGTSQIWPVKRGYQSIHTRKISATRRRRRKRLVGMISKFPVFTYVM